MRACGGQIGHVSVVRAGVWGQIGHLNGVPVTGRRSIGLAEAREDLVDHQVHLLVHLLAGQPRVVEEEADVLEVEQVAPEAEGVDDVVDRADDLDLLLDRFLDGGREVERHLVAVGAR